MATLETRRVGVRVVSGERSLADVVLDSVEVLGDGRAGEAFVELEVELVDGDEDDLDRLSDVLRRAGAHRTNGTPKLMRVLELADERGAARKAPAVEHLRFLLTRQLRELETYDPGVRLGVEPEDLHRFRVATRRSRALIRASRPLLGSASTRSARSCAGSAGRSARPATSTCCSTISAGRREARRRRGRAARRSSRSSTRSGETVRGAVLEALAERPLPRAARPLRGDVARARAGRRRSSSPRSPAEAAPAPPGLRELGPTRRTTGCTRCGSRPSTCATRPSSPASRRASRSSGSPARRATCRT